MNKPENLDSKKIVRLFIHESSRVFFDRFSSEQEQKWFYDLLITTVRNSLKEDLKMTMRGIYSEKLNFNSLEPLLSIRFSDIMDDLSSSDRRYDEITEYNKAYIKIESFLEDYNSTSKKPMNLVLFEFAIDHILKILRILKLEKGNAMLIGLGGSGRQSLSRLASFIHDYSVYEIEMSKMYGSEQWKQDLMRIMTIAGANLKNLVLILSESQFKKNFVLEDINNILNTGDIPNLFTPDDFFPLIDRIRNNAKKEGKIELFETGTNSQFYDFFIEKVLQHLHVKKKKLKF